MPSSAPTVWKLTSSLTEMSIIGEVLWLLVKVSIHQERRRKQTMANLTVHMIWKKFSILYITTTRNVVFFNEYNTVTVM